MEDIPKVWKKKIANVGTSDAQVTMFSPALSMKGMGNNWGHNDALTKISTENSEGKNFIIPSSTQDSDIYFNQNNDGDRYVVQNTTNADKGSSKLDDQSNAIVLEEQFGFNGATNIPSKNYEGKNFIIPVRSQGGKIDFNKAKDGNRYVVQNPTNADKGSSKLDFDKLRKIPIETYEENQLIIPSRGKVSDLLNLDSDIYFDRDKDGSGYFVHNPTSSDKISEQSDGQSNPIDSKGKFDFYVLPKIPSKNHKRNKLIIPSRGQGIDIDLNRDKYWNGDGAHNPTSPDKILEKFDGQSNPIDSKGKFDFYVLPKIPSKNHKKNKLIIPSRGQGIDIDLNRDKYWSGDGAHNPTSPDKILEKFDGQSNPIDSKEKFNSYLPRTNDSKNFPCQKFEFFTDKPRGYQFPMPNGFYDVSGENPTTPTPESGTLLLFGLGLLGASIAYRRKRQNRENASKVQFLN